MRRFCRVAVWMLPLGLLSVAPSLAADPGAPQIVPMEIPIQAPVSTNLEAEIFGVGVADPAIQAATGYWGRCTQSCAPCWSLTGCPPDDDGTPQYCWRYCP